ncbi:hypothetical protein DMZ48_04965 [Robertkochia solimangrovi]|nr:hypothetical protein DMZ48_04965 [Robertkochia solimangrovi]
MVLFIGITLFSCSKDDGDSLEDAFYRDKLSNANISLLTGTWSLYAASYEDITVEVPENDNDCGRDFIVFNGDGGYKEFILSDSYQCNYDSIEGEWTYDDGVITISNGYGLGYEMVLTQLNTQQMTFRAKLDIDDDGIDDIITFIAKPYTPNDFDIYSDSFYHNSDQEHKDKIRFDWQSYKGFNVFNRYEIYRTNGYNKDDAVLVTSIGDQGTNFFIDVNPPAEERLFYFFRLYTDQGKIAESEVHSVDTGELLSTGVTSSSIMVSGETIDFSWEKFDGYYFSHYEISTKETEGYFYGSSNNERTVAIIDDINTTSFSDTNPPFYKDPIYTVYVVDIFGNRSSNIIMGKQAQGLVFKRQEVTDFVRLEKFAPGKNESVIYLYGTVSGEQGSTIHRYNYGTNTVEAIADVKPPYYTDSDLKVFNSSYGEEIVLLQAGEFYVYDGTSLTLKYKITPQENFGLDDYIVLENGLWVVSDHDYVNIYKRNTDVLELIDRQPHFEKHQSSGLYYLKSLTDNRIMIGHRNEPYSYIFSYDSEGMITLIDTTVPTQTPTTLYSSITNTLINSKNKNILDGDTYQSVGSYIYPAVPNTISKDGDRLLGSNNDPLGMYTHEKKAYIYEIDSQTELSIETKGYPHYLFESYDGKLISISTGLLRSNLTSYIAKECIFMEEVTP